MRKAKISLLSLRQRESFLSYQQTVVLVAERDLLEAEANQAVSDVNLRRNLVAIYTAAGGGWADQIAAGAEGAIP